MTMERIVGITGSHSSALDAWLNWLLTQSLGWAIAAILVAFWFRMSRPRSTSVCHAIVASAIVICTLIGVIPKWGPGWLVLPSEPTSASVAPSSSHRAGPESTIASSVTSQHHEQDQEDPRDTERSEVVANNAVTTDANTPKEDPPAHLKGGSPNIKVSDQQAWGYLSTFLLALWVIGVCLLSIRMVLSLKELVRWRQSAMEMPASERMVFEECRKESKVRRAVLVGMHDAVQVPMVLCGLPVMILVPKHWLDWSNESRRAAWHHELSHVQRWDDLWRLLSEALRIVWWFHPGVRWLLAQRELASELLCDEAVVRGGCPPQRLAELLLDASRKALQGRDTRHLIATSFLSKRTMQVRIERLFTQAVQRKLDEKNSLWRQFAIIVGIAAITLCGSMRMIADESELPPSLAVTSSDQNNRQGEELEASPASNESQMVAHYVTIVGKLVDDETGMPIEKASWEWGMNDPTHPSQIAWGFSKQYGRDLPGGAFEQPVHYREDGSYDRLRVFAAGYEVTEVIDALPLPRPKQLERVVRLKPLGRVRGVLRDHQGMPLAQAKVFFIPEGHRSNIVEGKTGADSNRWPIERSRDGAVAETVTDERGHFELPANRRGVLAASAPLVDLWTFPVPEQGAVADLRLPEPGKVLIDLRYGYTEELSKKGKEAISVDSESPNQCWINITRDPSNEPHWKSCEYNRQLLVMHPSSNGFLSKGVLRSERKDTVLAGGNGEFRNFLLEAQIEVALPPGKYRVQRLRSTYQPIEEAWITVEGGSTAPIHWSRTEGMGVRGQIHLPSNCVFVRQEGEAPRKLDWSVPSYGKVYVRSGERFYDSVRAKKDGSFWIREHLPAGKYTLIAEVHLPESDFRQMISSPVLGPEDLGLVEVELTIEARETQKSDDRKGEEVFKFVDVTIPTPTHSIRIQAGPSNDSKGAANERRDRQRMVVRVADHRGDPIRDAQVYFVPQGQKPFVAELLENAKRSNVQFAHGETDAEGRFSLEASGTGTCVVARNTGDVQLFAIQDATVNTELTLAPPASIELGIDEWQFVPDDAMERDADVELLVYRLDREDLWGHLDEFRRRVRFSTKEGASTLPGTQVLQRSQTIVDSTQAKGKQVRTRAIYRFELPAGRYLIQRTSDAGPYDIGSPEPITVNAGSVVKIDWTTPRGAPVQGKILVSKGTQFVRSPGEQAKDFDWSLPLWAYVHVRSEKGIYRAKGIVASDGTFTLNTHLPPGKYRMETWIAMPAKLEGPRSLAQLEPPELEATATFEVLPPTADPAATQTMRLILNANIRGERWFASDIPAK